MRPPRPPRPGDNLPPPAPPVSPEAPADDPPPPPEKTIERGPQRFPCAQCGAQLEFDPGAKALSCKYCGHENAIEQAETRIEELDFRTYLSELSQAADTEEATEIKCEACGASVEPPPDLAALPCPFCGSNLVGGTKTRRLIKPQALLPFAIKQDEAQARYRHWLRNLWFAPSKLKKYARLADRMRGVYLPFWTYDANTVTSYVGQRGEYYYVTVGSGKNRRRVRRTRWYPASGVVHNRFNDLLILASRSVPKREADRLEPWGLIELVPYEPAYVSGFTAEHYQVELDEGFAEAQQRMRPEIRETVRWDIGGDTQRIHSMDTRYHDVTFKHILLPAWVSAYRFKDKVYRFLVNGRSGEVQGEWPLSWVKVLLVILAALILIGGIAYAYMKMRG